MSRYIDLLCREIDLAVERISPEEQIHTIYLGGGTPSYLPAPMINRVLHTIRKGFNITPDAEITIEANPGTLDQEKVDAYLTEGINRISLGVQSTHASELALLDRIHSYQDAIEAISMAKGAGIQNISLDLIYGLPGQELSAWEETVERVLQLGTTHLSLYSLTIEEGTPLFDQVAAGRIAEPDPDLAGEMLEWAMTRLAKTGYEQYEISNWAWLSTHDRDYRSKHNLQYWLNERYFGFGAGAHEYYDGLRVANVRTIPAYIQKMNQSREWKEAYRPAAETWIEIPVFEQMQDEMMLRFRLIEEGVDLALFISKFGVGAEDIFGKKIKSLQEKGLIEIDLIRNRLRLTRRGILMGNQVFMEFVGDD